MPKQFAIDPSKLLGFKLAGKSTPGIVLGSKIGKFPPPPAPVKPLA